MEKENEKNIPIIDEIVVRSLSNPKNMRRRSFSVVTVNVDGSLCIQRHDLLVWID